MLEQVGTNGRIHLSAPFEALLGKAQVYLAETREALCRALDAFIAQKLGNSVQPSWARYAFANSIQSITWRKPKPPSARCLRA